MTTIKVESFNTAFKPVIKQWHESTGETIPPKEYIDKVSTFCQNCELENAIQSGFNLILKMKPWSIADIEYMIHLGADPEELLKPICLAQPVETMKFMLENYNIQVDSELVEKILTYYDNHDLNDEDQIDKIELLYKYGVDPQVILEILAKYIDDYVLYSYNNATKFILKLLKAHGCSSDVDLTELLRILFMVDVLTIDDVKLFVDLGADAGDYAVLVEALHHKNIPVVQYLINLGSLIDKLSDTSLAYILVDVEQIKFLFECGLTPNSHRCRIIMTHFPTTETAKLLMENGATFDDLQYALQESIKNYKPWIIFLVESGCDLNQLFIKN
jgi:hypothetical protein